MMAMIWWAFGWRALCVALAVFATNFPSRFYWTGGAFLRWDWLFYLVGGICLLRKEKCRRWAASSSAYTTLLRVFPVFVFVGPLMVLVAASTSRNGTAQAELRRAALLRIDRRCCRRRRRAGAWRCWCRSAW